MARLDRGDGIQPLMAYAATPDAWLSRKAFASLASAGGTENIHWLLGIAKSPTEPMQRRRRVLSQLGRLDDPRVRDALKDMIEK